MQEKFLFEYAVIRVVPRVEREEFVNAGVILYCSGQQFLKSIYLLDRERIQAFSPSIDVDVLEENLCAFERISHAADHSGPIGQYDAPSRFRWLTATRSTVIQCSKVHAGFCSNADETLLKLYEQLVLNP